MAYVRAARGTKILEQLQELHREDPSSIGANLGLVAYRANIPAETIAKAIGVTIPTVFRWYAGIKPNGIARRRALQLTGILALALRAGELPIEGERDQIIAALAGAIRKYKNHVRT
jgi:hypothetical protein